MDLPSDLTGPLPGHVCSAIAAAASLIDQRTAQTQALEYELAVDVALALAAYEVSARELGRRTGLGRRRIAQLSRMSVR